MTAATSIDIPYPGKTPADDVDKIERLGTWGRWWLGIWPIIEADTVNQWLRKFRWTYHYTGSSGWAGIASSGVIRNGSMPIGGPIWFTQFAYPAGEIADELLALCGEPSVGYYAVRLTATNAGPLLPVASKTCEEGTYMEGTFRKGGGEEQIAASPISALPITRYRIPRTLGGP